MTLKEKDKIERAFDKNPSNFSCHFCKNDLGIKDCKGCPLYCQGFSDD